MQIIIKRRVDGPSTPELGQPTSVTFSSVTVPLNRPSTGPAPISSYTIQRSLNGTTWTTAATGALIFGNPPVAFVDGGRLALTTYFYRALAEDTGGRVSVYGATVSVTTASTATPSVPLSLYSNPFNEAVAYLQGNTSGNGVENATTRAELSRYDAAVLQWKWPAAQSLETTYMGQLRSSHPHLKLLMYCDARFWIDGDQSGATTTVVYNVLNSAGAPARWKAENVANDHLAHRFYFTNSNASNPTDITSTNAAGDTYAVAFIKQLETYFQLSLYDGVMFDDVNMIGCNINLRGVDSDVSWDYLNNGTAPSFTADAAAKADFAAGQAYLIDTVYRSRHPGKLVDRNTDPTYWYRQTEANG